MIKALKSIQQTLLTYPALAFMLSAVFSPFVGVAAEPSVSEQQSIDWEVELKAINEEIKSLSKELSDFRKRALNEEMKAQPQMFDSWHEFAKNIQLSEEDEKKIFEIKERLRKLNERRKALLKSHSK